MPISRVRWKTVMLNELKMRKPPTKRAIAAKKYRITLNALSSDSTSEALFCGVSTVTPLGSRRPSRRFTRAISSAPPSTDRSTSS